MTTPATDSRTRPLPRHVAVIGAAGGLGQGILGVCRQEGIGFTAIVRSRPQRIVVTNTLLSPAPGEPAGRMMRLFSWMPGRIGAGAAEQRAVVDALGRGAFASLRWTLVRAGLNSRGRDERPVASADWAGALNSWMPVSYQAMGRWMLEEAAANQYIRAAPLVSRLRHP